MIDLYKIKKKVENSLNNKKYNEKYIPINFQFLDNYLNKNNLLLIYQNVKLNSIINNSNENLSNEEIYQNIIKSNILNELNVQKGKAIISDDLFPKRNDINKDI